MHKKVPAKNGIAKSEKLNGEPFSTFPTTQNTPKIQAKSNAKQTFFFILNAPFFFVVMIITNNFIIVNMFFKIFLYFFEIILKQKRRQISPSPVLLFIQFFEHIKIDFAFLLVFGACINSTAKNIVYISCVI